ncbi:MAG: TetR family transcriptional regulator C-terminal domain-containing protein [Spirochaetales bacterium]|nr:TetR family transcriptional regulator C-terminal domain-containing protein [Spirochaetales bacterium]
MHNKENQRIALSRKMLQGALLRLLERKNIDEIKIVELCKEAELNRSTFYRLYSIPSEVQKEIIENIITEVYITISKKEDKFKYIYDYISSHRNLLSVLVRNLDDYFLSILENKYYLFLKKDCVLDVSEEQLRYTCTFQVAGFLAILKRFLASEKTPTPEEITAILKFHLIASNLH